MLVDFAQNVGQSRRFTWLTFIPGDQRSPVDLDGGNGELPIFPSLHNDNNDNNNYNENNDEQVITLIWEFTLLSILFSYDTTFGFVLTFAILQVSPLIFDQN